MFTLAQILDRPGLYRVDGSDIGDCVIITPCAPGIGHLRIYLDGNGHAEPLAPELWNGDTFSPTDGDILLNFDEEGNSQYF